MRSANMFVFRGRTTADIDVKQVGDFSVCEFSLAVDRPYRKDKEKETDFFNLTAYRNTADFLSKYVPKGTMIAVTGEARVKKWDDKEGNKRSKVEFVVEQVELVVSKNRTQAEDGAGTNDGADDDLPF